MKIHKADYKTKVNHYVGFGEYDLVPTSLCGGAFAYYAGYKMTLSRTWSKVTCKKCLAKKDE